MNRLLFVHAHPDDETLTCGITMAHHVAMGDDVHVLTCTLGEEGEVVAQATDLVHLQGAAGDPLGPHRLAEVTEAMRRLGVHHHLLTLDGPNSPDSPDSPDGAQPGRPRYRDSGMVGMPSASHPSAFAAADVDEVGELVAERIRRLRPDAVVTYDPTGGYEHPDHVQTHRVTMAALRRLAPDDRPELVFHIATPRAWVRADRRWLRDHVPSGLGLTLPSDDDPVISSVVDDDLVTHVVVDPVHMPDQIAALGAHRTQLRVWDGGFFALTNDVAARLAGREAFIRVDPATGERLGPEAAGEVSRDGRALPTPASGLLPPR